MSYLDFQENVFLKVLPKVKPEHQAVFCSLTLSMFVYERYTGNVELCAINSLKEIFEPEVVDEVLNEWFIEERSDKFDYISYRPIVELINFVEEQ